MISVIITNYNGEKFIKSCLEAILASNYRAFEIIVVDDGSNDKSKEILKNYRAYRKIKILYLEKNKGAAIARNQGAKESKGNILFFLDIDTKINRTCLQQIAQAFAQKKQLGAVQPKLKLIPAKARQIETIGHFLSPFGFPYEITRLALLDKEKRIFGGRSAALAVRRKLFNKIGKFDADYLIYGEDTDLCWRIWIAGYPIHYLPQATVAHYSKSSLEAKTRQRIFYEGAKNNTSNILKNAPFSILFWMLPLHIAVWFIVGVKLIIRRQFAMARLIYCGLWWNVLNLRHTLAKRKMANKYQSTNSQIKEIIFGPLTLNEILIKSIAFYKKL